MKRVGLALTLVALLGSFGHAQVTGVALAALSSGQPLAGFIGPWRATQTGVDILYTILCYDTQTREKRLTEVIASIPDGSSLAAMRTIATTAVVDSCDTMGVTVQRGAVILPAIQLGQ